MVVAAHTEISGVIYLGAVDTTGGKSFPAENVITLATKAFRVMFTIRVGAFGDRISLPLLLDLFGTGRACHPMVV